MKRLLVLIVLLVALPTTAHAHGDTGTLELLEATVLDDGVRYVVLLTYANDGETVPDTKVTVAVDGTAPVAMSYEGEGRYAATVPAPEGRAHDVVFSSEEPAATLTYRQEADAPQTSTTTSIDSSVGRRLGFRMAERIFSGSAPALPARSTCRLPGP